MRQLPSIITHCTKKNPHTPHWQFPSLVYCAPLHFGLQLGSKHWVFDLFDCGTNMADMAATEGNKPPSGGGLEIAGYIVLQNKILLQANYSQIGKMIFFIYYDGNTEN